MPAAAKVRFDRAPRRRRPAGRRGRRRSSRRARCRSSPTPTRCCRRCAAGRACATRCSCPTCAAWSGRSRPGADAIAVFTAASEAFTQANIAMTIAESLRARSRPCSTGRPRPRHVDARVRVDGVRLPVRGRRRAGRRGGRRRGAGGARLRRDLDRRHDRRRPARAGAAGRRGGRRSGAGRAAGAAPARHGRPGARERRGRPRGRGRASSTPRPAASAAARSPRARPATWRPRRWSRSWTSTGSRPASIWTRCARPGAWMRSLVAA